MQKSLNGTSAATFASLEEPESVAAVAPPAVAMFDQLKPRPTNTHASTPGILKKGSQMSAATHCDTVAVARLMEELARCKVITRRGNEGMLCVCLSLGRQGVRVVAMEAVASRLSGHH